MKTETTIVREKTFDTVKSAVNKMVDVIRPTFGPASNKVIIDKLSYRMVVDDGVQIARDFALSDPAENAVVKIVREALVKTNDLAGDGTTGAGIMLQAIINEVARKTRFDGRKVELELKKALDEVREEIRATAKPITTKEDLTKAALVSFDDEKIADMIADTYFKLGKDAVITVEKSPNMTTSVHISEGVTFGNGFISPYMVNHGERMECVLEKPYILITDYRITESSDILPILENMAKAGNKNLVVIAENVEQSALATLVLNLPHVINPQTQKGGTMPSVAICHPKSDQTTVFLEDLALLTGAKVFSSSKGDKLEAATIADLGRAEKIIVRREETIIVKPSGNIADISMARTSLKSAIENEPDTRKKAELEQRLGMFTNSLATIKVGAPTEGEQKALKYKVEDAVNATKAAFKSGVVCGAGLALARIHTSSPILNEALKYPSRQLRENMGLDGEQELKVGEALNVVTGKTGPFMDVGVMDAADVLLAGVESAVSIATLLITSSGMIVETHTDIN